MVEIVNIVASGSLNIELDLSAVSQELAGIADYDPEKYPGVYFRFGESKPLVTLYRTGKYIVTGGSSVVETEAMRTQFLQRLVDSGMIEEADDEWFKVQNLVCTADLDRALNLNALAIGLGLEDTEYEPEQFPGLIYRPSEYDAVVLLFATGKIVVTGSPDIETAERTVTNVKKKVSDLLEM